jgi:uncharacterized membrane protein YphA (DoxX/SURF4 family)
MAYVVLICRCLIGFVFVISALSKIRNRAAFQSFVTWLGSLPIPGRGRPIIPFAVVVAEVATAIMVWIPAVTTAGLALAACVMALFTLGVIAVLRSGMYVPCLCFGPSATPLGIPQLARNAVLCAIAAVGAVLSSRNQGPIEMGGLTLAVGVAVVVTVFAVLLDDLIGLFESEQEEF